MNTSDLEAAAEIHKLTFVRQKQSYEWLQCNFNAFPRVLCFVAENNDKQISGFIIWTQKSGFRPEVILEIEQLAVSPDHQGKGIGRGLITQTLPLVKERLAQNDSVLKHIYVTTRADNFAQNLYKSTLGAEVEATISNLYSADEVLMVARNVG
ncbi:GNAT family N-acetyltransferase [Vibrio sp. ZSDZ65]|uniref:GNAT family N-acetyltransferase n=1 Tax=Vibrio qingdaonensis TaxID=2829491 RepID=A0A9X3CLI9_9VIBR|nr:GNAT family N-acetyltransferase [Vibrio qingdaonensis]MCW8344610.1 GNAT family N-acetyltransferase [Vibrio qingdaonensis]